MNGSLGKKKTRPFKSCKNPKEDDSEEHEVIREACKNRYLEGPSSRGQNPETPEATFASRLETGEERIVVLRDDDQ